MPSLVPGAGGHPLRRAGLADERAVRARRTPRLANGPLSCRAVLAKGGQDEGAKAGSENANMDNYNRDGACLGLHLLNPLPRSVRVGVCTCAVFSGCLETASTSLCPDFIDLGSFPACRPDFTDP